MASNYVKTEVVQESEITEEVTEEVIDACSNVKMASNDVKTEVDQESEITEEITEETKDACSKVRVASDNVETEVDQKSEITEEITEDATDACSNVRVASNDVKTQVDQESEITKKITEEATDGCSNVRVVSNDVKTELDQKTEITKKITEQATDACRNVRVASDDVETEVDQKSEITEEITEEATDACSNVRMASDDVKIEVVQELKITEKTTEEATDACSNVSLASNDVKTEVDREAEISERTIEANFKRQRSYLETHINVSDLIVYYELFTREERRKLHQENYVSRESAAQLAFSIIEERTQSDKYTQLLFALDNAGCPKLVDLLTGKLVPENTINRQRINTATRHICERLNPSNILHYLVSYGVISFGESEKIAKKQKTESRTDAALDLLFILPNRSKDWYVLFLKALDRGDEHAHLAELIDPRKAAQLKAQRSAEIKKPLSDSDMSCDESKPGKTVTQSYERMTLTTDQRSAVIKDSESKQRTPTGTTDLWCDMCYNDTGDMVPAYSFCSKCIIFICKPCDGNHRKWLTWQNHATVQVGQLQKPQAYQPVKYLDCTTHPGNLKDHYCEEHDEFTCTECMKQIHQNCNTSALLETSSDIIAIKHFVSVVDDLRNDSLLTKSAFKRNVADIDSQKIGLIKLAKEERDKIISRAGKLYENTMVSEACEQKKAYISERIMSLDNIIHYLEEINTDITRKLKIPFDQNLIIRMHQHVEKVKEYKSAIENMNKETSKISLSFLPSSEVSTFLSVSKSLGTVREIKDRSDISQVNVNKISSLDILLKQEKETCSTNGIAVTSKGVVLFSDSNNKSVKSFSQDNKLLSSLTFSEETFDISVINDQTAAVSTYTNKLHILNISDSANISIDRSVSLGYWPGGMTHYKGNLIVTSWTEPKCVKMIDLKGQEKWSVSVDYKGQQVFDNPYSVTISTSNDTSTVIVSDWGKDTLNLIDPNDGHLIRTIDVKGKQPHGLTSDNDGNVYVCYFRTYEIRVFSPDFQKSCILLSSSDLRGHPTNVVYCGNSDILYIACQNSDTVDCFQLA